MVNPQLVEYIKMQLAAGESKDAIRADLMSSRGWNVADINEAFNMAGAAPAPVTSAPLPPVAQAPTYTPPATPIQHAPVYSSAPTPQTPPTPPTPPPTTPGAYIDTTIGSPNIPVTQMPPTMPAAAPTIPATPMPAPAPAPTAQNPGRPSIPFIKPAVRYAGFWIRVLATLLDAFIINLPISALVFFLFKNDPNSVTTLNRFMPLVLLLITWVYFVWMTSAFGATLGKMLLGLEVRSQNLDRLSFGHTILRETAGKLISALILYIGFLMAAFTSNKQGLHDKLAQSVVIYKDPTQVHTGRVIIAVILVVLTPALMAMAIMTFVGAAFFSSLGKLGTISSTMNGQATTLGVTGNVMKIQSLAEAYATSHSGSYSYAKACDSGMYAENNFKSVIKDLNGHSLMCAAEDSSYAISAKQDDGVKSFCVDSSGYQGGGSAVDDGKKASCKPDANGYGLLPGTY